MKILIAYATTHGCTEKCAQKLAANLPQPIELVNLKKSKNVNPADFDLIVIGGSIHAGRVQSIVKNFCTHNLEQLRQKKVGLFLCCMEEGEKAQMQFETAFPKELQQHALAHGIFGGEFDFEKMNFVMRAMIKKIARIDKSVSKIAEEKIVEFAQKLNSVR